MDVIGVILPTPTPRQGPSHKETTGSFGWAAAPFRGCIWIWPIWGLDFSLFYNLYGIVNPTSEISQNSTLVINCHA
jgi:hypothetical protein